jgi:thiamine biosynthesis lipoprotein
MGTTYSVTLRRLPGGPPANALRASIEGILEQVNRGMSTYDTGSELSRFNRSETSEWVDVSPELLRVLREALRVSSLTGGAFDPTVGPLVDLWGFGPGESTGAPPPDEAIERARARVGADKILLRETPPGMRKTRADVSIDLSAIAKGHAVDRIADHLEGLGLADYLVEIGGEIRGKGRSPEGRPWRVAIEEPEPGRRRVRHTVELRDGAVATSGGYRNFRVHEGRRDPHLLDPRTGRPARHPLASVTVIARTAMEADAWATALAVMGPDAGLEAARVRSIAALFRVIEEGGLRDRVTREFEAFLVEGDD